MTTNGSQTMTKIEALDDAALSDAIRTAGARATETAAASDAAFDLREAEDTNETRDAQATARVRHVIAIRHLDALCAERFARGRVGTWTGEPSGAVAAAGASS